MSVLKLKTSLICNGPESDKAKAEYLLQTRDTITADVCTAPTLSSLSTRGWSAWSCMSSASLGTAVSTNITSRGPTSGTPWRGRCCTADTPGPHTSPPGTDNTHCRILERVTHHIGQICGSNNTTLAIILHIGIRKQIFCMLPE